MTRGLWGIVPAQVWPTVGSVQLIPEPPAPVVVTLPPAPVVTPLPPLAPADPPAPVVDVVTLTEPPAPLAELPPCPPLLPEPGPTCSPEQPVRPDIPANAMISRAARLGIEIHAMGNPGDGGSDGGRRLSRSRGAVLWCRLSGHVPPTRS